MRFNSQAINASQFWITTGTVLLQRHVERRPSLEFPRVITLKRQFNCMYL